MITILDCYTDEPAGLGVPPYLGTYPRYIAGSLSEEYNYITIDDLRFYKYYNLDDKKKEVSHKTNIKIYNLTKNIGRIKEILDDTTELIVIAGVHTPGKYLSAIPGTLKEITELVGEINCKKILTGPAVYGTSIEGGKFAEKVDLSIFDQVKDFSFSYDKIKDYAVRGVKLVEQIGAPRIIELETAKGCSRKIHCSFCTEPLKNKVSFRNAADITNEVKEFNKYGIRNFRLGKQTCYYSHPEAIDIIKDIREKCKVDVLHIDNVNPVNVVTNNGVEITKQIVKYCTEGNTAAFGVESFDPVVVKENNLNSDPEVSYEAARILNKYGAARGPNGMPKFLPGINLLYGLIGESKNTNTFNLDWLTRFMDEGLLIRRINIRQVDIFNGTPLYKTVGNKYIKKNKKYYWKWRDEIRQKVDYPMLQKLVPLGTVLKDMVAEIYDGNTTFCRQIGTYPLIVGVKGRLVLGKSYGLKIKGHMLRSIIGEVA
ncbi:MAG: radical SAM protein [Nanoarchaeota archaeon]|nr:radical SAM protein [Nanoarchaeota archaeon]MBU1704290.1 radical SAM protein [Nanoarchaeota archaeon]